MENFNLRKTVFAAAFLVLASFTAVGQMPGGAGAMNSSLLKLFGTNTTFTARIDVQVFDGARALILRMPMDFSALDGKMRADTDMGQAKGKIMPPTAVATFQQYGLDRISSVTRPDKKMIYIIFPRVQSVANMTMSKEDADATTQTMKVEKTPLGKQTVDGHPCTKNHVVVKDPKGNPLVDATTWNAADMKDFPLQIETKESGNTSVMRFQQVSFARPEVKLFEPPAGYKQYSNPNDLMVAAAQKSPAPAAKAPAKSPAQQAQPAVRSPQTSAPVKVPQKSSGTTIKK